MAVLSAADRDLWRGFRGISERINTTIEHDLVAATNLSGSDHGILSRLAGTETQAARQQELCDAMRWDRTRLSHHLTRMERRGLVKRSKAENGGTFVRITAQGRRARKEADPVHADAVMRCFISKLAAPQRKELAALVAALSTIE